MKQETTFKKNMHRLERIKRFLELRMAQMLPYHDHKEKMAHAGLVISLALMGAILSIDPWPPKWIPDNYFFASRLGFAITGITVLWIFLHVNIRWQLRKRRFAASYVECILRLLKKWLYEDPPEEDLVPFTGREDSDQHKCKFEKQSRLLELIDKYFFPVKNISILGDEGKEYYPVVMICQMNQVKTGAIFAERLVTSANIFIFIITIFGALHKT